MNRLALIELSLCGAMAIGGVVVLVTAVAILQKLGNYDTALQASTAAIMGAIVGCFALGYAGYNVKKLI